MVILFPGLVCVGQCPVTDPTTADDCIFQSGQATLTVSGSSGYYVWYADANGDTALGSGAAYLTPTLNSSETFYVSATDTNTGLQFDGANDYIALDKFYNTAASIPQITVEAWVNTSISGNSDEYGNWAIVDFDRSEYFNLFVRADNGEIGFSTYAGTGGIDDFYSGVPVNDGNWHHIVGVYDGTDKIIYADGIEVARRTNAHGGVALGSGTTRYGIIGDGSEAGAFNGNRNNRYFDGTIDEIRIWNDVRTPSEIALYKDTCLTGGEANLETYLDFNEYSGSTLNDLTGNGANGTLYNFNISTAWIQGAPVRCDCESNLVPALVTLESSLQDTILTCGEPSIVLDAGPSAATYNWSTGATSQTITVTQNGFYEINTSGGTCNGSARVAVEGFTHAENALVFDGVNDYAAIENMFYNGTDYTELTVELWLKTNDAGDQMIASFDRSEYWRVEINGSGAGNGQIGFDLATNSGIVDFGSSSRVDDGQWHHVACVFDNGLLEIFIDGILDGSTSFGNRFGTGDLRYGFLGTGSEANTYNGVTGPNDYFNGEMDEFKIWNKALSESEIRDHIARHISGKSSNLQVYYKFDDISNDTIFDHNTRSINNAVMFNFGAGSEIISDAPIGDESVYIYTGSWGGVTTSINSCDGESLTVSNITGTPSAVHLYYVNNFPNDLSGLAGTGVYDRYFGVHKIGDPTATYDASYNYTGNPYVNTSNEATVELYRRADNSTFPWVNTFGNLNNALNTIEAVGQNTEYIIDYQPIPLPVKLISFQGVYKHEEDVTHLTWSTASELNCDYYVVEKSTDGSNFYVFDTIEGSGSTNQKSVYNSYDFYPSRGISYYRLSQYDTDGLFEDLGIASIVKELDNGFNAFPNPLPKGNPLNINIDVDNDEVMQLQLLSMEGEVVFDSEFLMTKGSNTVQINLSEYISPGVYTLVFRGREVSQKLKLVVY